VGLREKQVMSKASSPEPFTNRMPTGIDGLDLILQGGLFETGIYVLIGKPGAGKTIMAHQICYHQIANGQQVLYVTLLSETHSRLLASLRSLSFFDEDVVGKSLWYFSGSATLQQGNLEAFLKFLWDLLKQYRPSLLVIDTLSLAEQVVDSEYAFAQFMSQFGAYLETVRCTALILTHPEHSRFDFVKNTMADGLLELSMQHIGRRIVRQLEVDKFRGGTFLEGKHTVQITPDGVKVFPRAETLFIPKAQASVHEQAFAKFGVSSLDSMLDGGLMSDSVTVLLGVPGSGKTLLGLHFLQEGARLGQKSLYFGFSETPSQLIRKANSIGLDFSKYLEQGLLEVLWQPPLEGLLDALAQQLLQIVQERGIKRLFLDGLNGFMIAADDPDRLESFFIVLTNELRSLNMTTLLSVEMHNLFSPSVESPVPTIPMIADNVILLRYVELRSHLYRLISILKMRENDYDTAIREFRIGNGGVTVEKTFKSAQAILTGLAIPTNSTPTAKTTRSRTRTRKQSR
jgi:circadian clock protein KaiC